MHKYFIIPITFFFTVISLFVFYLQFINENWKFIAPKNTLPDICNDNNSLELITHSTDYIKGRSFIDNLDKRVKAVDDKGNPTFKLSDLGYQTLFSEGFSIYYKSNMLFHLGINFLKNQTHILF